MKLKAIKTTAALILSVMLACAAVLVGVTTAEADSVSKSLVVKDGVGFVCTDGYGNYTTDAIKVSTKGGTTSVTCRFAPGQNSWRFWQPGQRYSERGYGDCSTIGWNGERAYMDSHFEITPNGAAVMTCH
jgi:hypothetical protein